jgi:hypothetical protein
MNNSPSGHGPWVKYHSIIFEQVGHETTYTNFFNFEPLLGVLVKYRLQFDEFFDIAME